MPGIESLSDLERCNVCDVEACNNVLRFINGGIRNATWAADVAGAPDDSIVEIAKMSSDSDQMVEVFRAFDPGCQLSDDKLGEMVTEANYYFEIVEGA